MIDQLYAWADQAADQHGVPRNLFRNLVARESSWNPGAVSNKGAVGLTQLMPGTAGDLRVDPNDPRANLFGGAQYLRQQYDRFGNWDHALAAYNWGGGNVNSNPNPSQWPSSVQGYVSGINGGSPQNTGALSEGFSNASALKSPQNLMQSLGFDINNPDSLPTFMKQSVPAQNGDVGMNPVGAFGSRLPDPPKTQAEQVLSEMDAPEWMQKLGKYAKGRKSVDQGGHMDIGLSAAGGVRGYEKAQDAGEGLTRLLSLLSGLGGGVQSRRRG